MKPNKETQITNKQLEQVLLRACREAGGFIRDHAFEDLHTEWKKTDDPVTYLDKKAEQLIRKRIQEHTNATFVGEEYGTRNGTSDITIYIDLIDGTKSFARKEFLSAVSIGAEHDGKLVAGCIYDFMRDIMYSAGENGAFMNYRGKSYTLPRKDMPIFSQKQIETNNESDKYLRGFDHTIIEKPTGTRLGSLNYKSRTQTGSIALAMAHFAAGSINAMILAPEHSKSATHDIAAGILIMQKAGITTLDYNLQPFDHKNPGHGLIALDKTIKDEALSALQDHIDPLRKKKIAALREEQTLNAYRQAYGGDRD